MNFQSLNLSNVSQAIGDESHPIHNEKDEEQIRAGLPGVPDNFNLIQIVFTFVNPSIAVVGVLGNLLSIHVLRKSGLRTTSNILLLALAVADTLFLIGMINFTDLIYNNGQYWGWPGPWLLSYSLFVLWKLHFVITIVGHFCSMIIPALITTERLIAVLFPLQFHLVVTPRRIWWSLFACVVFGLSYALFDSLTNFDFHYGFFPERNATFGIRVEHVDPHMAVTKFRLQKAFFFVGGVIPLPYVLIGCIVIGVKVKMANLNRQMLTSSSQQQMKEDKTTRMLVLVCIFYVVACSYNSILKFFPLSPSSNKFRTFEGMFLIINSSVNFIIYVVVNDNLRSLYLATLLCRRRTPH